MIVRISKALKSFDGKEALSSLDLELPKGQVVGLLGINGAGKTTLLKIISGLLQPDQGQVSVMDRPPRAGRRHVAFLGDRQGFPHWMKPKDILRVMDALYGDFRPEVFLDLVDALKVPGHAIAKMSRGQQQKLRLAATMARKTDLYLLDEPLAGIDIVARKEILRHLMATFKPPSTVVISTHEIHDVEPHLTRALFLVAGRVVEDIGVERFKEKGLANLFVEKMRGQEAPS